MPIFRHPVCQRHGRRRVALLGAGKAMAEHVARRAVRLRAGNIGRALGPRAPRHG